MLINPTTQAEINKALEVGTSHCRMISWLNGTHVDRVDVYCGGEFAETIRRTFYQVSRQWAVKYEVRMHRIFMRDERFAIEIEDEYAFRYTSTGKFPG